MNSKFQNKSSKVQAKPGNNNSGNNNNNNNSNNNSTRKFSGGNNNNANNNGGAKKKAAPPLMLKKSKITAQNCIPCKTTDEKRFISTVNKNKNQIHHNFVCPTDLQVDGKFHIKFPIAKSGPITVMTSENPLDRSYNLHLDIFGNYEEAYNASCVEIDALLSKFNANTTPQQLEDDLLKVLKERGFKLEEITQIMEDNIPAETEMTADYYRQVAVAFLICPHLAKDKKGQKLLDFCIQLRKDYCDHLDKHKADKSKIYSLTGIETKCLKEPASNLVNDIFSRTKHPENDKILPKKIDYSKSPTINFKIHESKPKDTNSNTDKLIQVSESGQVMWSKIYDYVANPHATLPISTYEEFERMIYCKGDSQANIKPYFKQMVQIDAMGCCVFWGEVQRRGSFQFKIATMRVSGYIPFAGGPKETTPEELTKTQEKIRKALAYYNVAPTPIPLPVAPVLTQTVIVNPPIYQSDDDDENGGYGSGNGGGDGENNESDNEINEHGKRPNGDDVCLDENDKVVPVKKTKFRS